MTDISLDETPAEEFSRLVIEHNEGKGSEREEAWNLIADFALEHCDAILRGLRSSPSHVAPANPAQVTDEMVEAACAAWDDAYEAEIKIGSSAYSDNKEIAMRAALIAAIGAGGQAVAYQWRKRDRVLKHDEVWSYVDYHTGLKIAEFPEKYEVRPLYTHPAPSGQAVQDTWFTDRALPVKAMSGDVEDNRVLRLHFRRPVTDDDRKSMCDALNLHQASLAHPQPLPLKDEVERVLDRIADEYGIPGPWDEKFKTAQSLARALLSRLRAGEQEGWREIEDVPDNKLGPFLVTNNPKALNAFNRPSHVWCVGSIHADDDGGFCAFNGYQKIHGLKLYMPVPLPSAPSEQGGDRS